MLSSPSPGTKCSLSLFTTHFTSLFSWLRELHSHKNRTTSSRYLLIRASNWVFCPNKPTHNVTCGMTLFHIIYYDVYGNLYAIIITWLTYCMCSKYHCSLAHGFIETFNICSLILSCKFTFQANNIHPMHLLAIFERYTRKSRSSIQMTAPSVRSPFTLFVCGQFTHMLITVLYVLVPLRPTCSVMYW